MRKPTVGILLAALLIVQLACNLPQGNGGSQGGPPQPQPLVPATLAVPTTALTATPTQPTSTPEATATPHDPLVVNSTLCWQGPGDRYTVVSGLAKGTTAKLLGVGSVPGWIILENPTYHDLCWAPAADIQLDPSVDVASLKVYSPPPLRPTRTPKPSPTP